MTSSNGSPDPTNTSDGGVDALLRFIRRPAPHPWAAGVAFLGGAAAPGAAALLAKRLYRSEGVILHRRGLASRVTGADVEQPRRVGLRLHEMLLSTPRLQDLVTTFNLYPSERARTGLSGAVDELRRHLTFD